jgi:dTDP-4-amino-4,6-dideoxygalactose transaminase
VVRTDRRDALRTHLTSRGVETGIHYPVPLHRQTAWGRAYGHAGSFPRAERLAAEILSLPVFPDLSAPEVETVVGAVESFFGAGAPQRRRVASARAPGAPPRPMNRVRSRQAQR